MEQPVTFISSKRKKNVQLSQIVVVLKLFYFVLCKSFVVRKEYFSSSISDSCCILTKYSHTRRVLQHRAARFLWCPHNGLLDELASRRHHARARRE
jgi:hypothetical protein